jgi:1-acyl-sn-glycerol-3-phosphate acyltransferase
MSERGSGAVEYAVPWDLVFGLGPRVVSRTATNVDRFTAAICARMDPQPLIRGWEELPPSACFVLVANHYQRKGLWILHSAAVLTQAIRTRYGPGDPPVRWVVTANWPRWGWGRWSVPSPGDIVLPRVADALACYPVALAGANPLLSARNLRRVLREAPAAARPLGLFPEGVAGSAGRPSEPRPGVARLLVHLARAGMPVQPAGLAESGDRLVAHFGETLTCETLLRAPDAAKLAMRRVVELSES